MTTWPDKTQDAIAEQVGCSQQTVGRIKQDIIQVDITALPETRTDAIGRTRPTTYTRKETQQTDEQAAPQCHTFNERGEGGYTQARAATIQAEANRKRSEAAKDKERKPDGTFQPVVVPEELQLDEDRNKGRAARDKKNTLDVNLHQGFAKPTRAPQASKKTAAPPVSGYGTINYPGATCLLSGRRHCAWTIAMT